MTRRGVVSIHDYPEHLNPFREDEESEVVQRKCSRKVTSPAPRHEAQAARRDQQTPPTRPQRPPPPSAKDRPKVVASSPHDDEDKCIRQGASSPVTTTPKSKPKTSTIKKKRPAPKPPSPSNSPGQQHEQRPQQQLSPTVPNGSLDHKLPVSTTKDAIGGESDKMRQDGERAQLPTMEGDEGRGARDGGAPVTSPPACARRLEMADEPTPPPRRKTADDVVATDVKVEQRLDHPESPVVETGRGNDDGDDRGAGSDVDHVAGSEDDHVEDERGETKVLPDIDDKKVNGWTDANRSETGGDETSEASAATEVRSEGADGSGREEEQASPGSGKEDEGVLSGRSSEAEGEREVGGAAAGGGGGSAATGSVVEGERDVTGSDESGMEEGSDHAVRRSEEASIQSGGDASRGCVEETAATAPVV